MKRIALGLVAVAALATACTGNSKQSGSRLSGSIAVDGSSTVFPISEAVAEEFRTVEPRIRVTIGVSGTGGGFKKFCDGRADINDASRPIKLGELSKAAANGISWIELPVAFDGICFVVHRENSFVDHLSVAELKKIWQPESSVKTWSQVRKGWPETPIKLYGPGPDSGTFDYFTEVINGKARACRSDYTASEDDNVLVQGVAGDKGALGFFGFAYYHENKDKLKLVPISNGAAPVSPSLKTINDGSYAPLSRPLFIYIRRKAADRPEVAAFMNFYLDQVPSLAKQVGYVPLQPKTYEIVRKRFAARKIGSAFVGAPKGMSIDDKLTGA